MARRIIDISVALQGEIASDPPGLEPKIKYYFDHREPRRPGESADDQAARAAINVAALKAVFLKEAATRDPGA